MALGATLNRLAVVGQLGIGATLMATVVISRLAPTDVPFSVTGPDPAA